MKAVKLILILILVYIGIVIGHHGKWQDHSDRSGDDLFCIHLKDLNHFRDPVVLPAGISRNVLFLRRH